MAEKKILNDDELAQVSGGFSGFTTKESMKFDRKIGQRVEIKKKYVFHQFTIGSNVRKLGYLHFSEFGEYEPCYYLVAIKENEQDWNGWYTQFELNSDKTA